MAEREDLPGENENEMECEEEEEVHQETEMKSDSSDSDSCDEVVDTAANEQKIKELQQQINVNPYLYDAHTEKIQLLRQMGELDQLREAREAMSQLFPLTEELWLDWLRDEIPLASDEEERKKIDQLFERAVKDYLSVPVWLEYVQYSIGGMGQKNGVDHIRSVFERALTAAGIHVTSGATLWEAYREFENAILVGLLPQPGQVATKQQEDEFQAQHQRVTNLFKRQLSIPLFDMQETMAEYKEWLQEEIDSYTQNTYQKAVSKLDKVKQFETDLLKAEAPRLDAYKVYLEYEMKEDDPTRIQCLFERALQENCLNADLWTMYTRYLDAKLKLKTVVLPVYERSVRNCPWCGQLWSKYLLAMERFSEPFEKIKDLIEKALDAGFSQGSEYLQVWSTYIDYLRRRIKWDEDHNAELDIFRRNIEKAVEHMTYFADGDPTGVLRQYWANIEAKFCKNLEKARELWNGIMTEGHGSQAVMWLDFYKMERMYGDNKHCRKVLQRGLNSVTDFPESIVEAYILFEREEGTLEQYEFAVGKCEAQMERIEERRTKAAEKEAAMAEKKQQNKMEKKSHRKTENATGGRPQSGQHQKHRGNNQQVWKGTQKQKVPGKQKIPQEQRAPDNPPKVEVSENKKDEFKVPPPPSPKTAPPPGYKGAPPPGYKGAPPPGYKGAPPPGYKGAQENKTVDQTEENSSNTAEPPTKKARIEETPPPSEQAGEDKPHDTSKYNRTAFVSNLDFSVDEDRIGQIFAECGEMSDIRLVKNFKGKSKGYAYVEFLDELCVVKALKLDRILVESRPMYVSKCEDKGHSRQQFKYATSLEKNKLFVKGLPFTCTKEALTQIFGEHGKLKDVRLVTYRNGTSKGLAYVVYEDEQTASQAVMKTDGLMIGEHTISVAISNPPERKVPVAMRGEESLVPSLGSGKKETEMRGKARTQVSLLPRSVQKPPTTGGPPKPSANQNASNKSLGNGDTSNASSTSGMSNADFRNLLLKK